MSTHLYLMGWNEILARIFEGFDAQRNVSPDWLINPATRRKLKIDLLYPEIGIAVRFAGLLAKGQGRKSDWEELEDESRDEVRKELCRLHGVELVLLMPFAPYPEETFKRLSMALSATSRRIATQGRFRGKAGVMERLANARDQLEQLRRRVQRLDDLTGYAELWRDREARVVSTLEKPAENGATPRQVAAVRTLQPGQWVEHERFGRGQVAAVEPAEGDLYLTIHFLTAGERRFLASLAADKLRPVRGG